MKIFKLCSLLVLLVPFTLACGGGSDGDDEPANSVEICENGDCVSSSENVEGNFTVGIYTENDATDMPEVSVDEDTLNVTCGGDKTTENGYNYFSCNLEGETGAIADVECIHGIVYLFIEGSTENVYSTGCTSVDFYCDQYGFYVAEVCANSTLVKGVEGEIAVDENVTKLLQN
ncbi:MAG: hypothetical protein A3G32_06705 [Deltaproteobacteria bacterium RIFCSPLOWO2_12_FULL_40_28]|nr:MAG: hypothetical protein A3C45_06750 [Deltaproteobacteria bacterium RIFCSPHIGHO2_02_FULL_40_28]OGQ19351.1 MAG: hypothetical protein A3E27_05065 [Deltaproteobacteria bacterium RIFCSPHIGHO2_12_FULL_40_32]OGQ40425.1 MAG: hypothetical protein A3I69_00005 [Deltaproteobacteria bacterium RIFCSPLOWO2_02_FULL_40_36]OGQ53661.1 MAG: hypothetical protein A3G32_06705 [Deltaproteobacteria bacterium RIFCSPLOWO2_12_FULL_40_28]